MTTVASEKADSRPDKPDARDEAAIRAVFDRMWEAWNRNDSAAYAASFSEGSDYVPFDGSRLTGRGENARLHGVLFETVLQGTRLLGEIESIRFVTSDVAIVHSVGAVLMPWQDRIHPRRKSRQTYVLVRRAEGWKVEAFHNTRVRPLPPIRPGSALVRLFRIWTRLRVALSGRRAEQLAGRPGVSARA